ncbi:cytochrome P450 4V2 [Trichonephila inaurata madagascariensis]|uniref:Cytochrome P450 4V2 n=1 Tax=Trichonephila inaurata madagascariensis TaxID=2747483 RepID=A0A8X6XXM4_9ARAC|nr:cytochrome P450 4V2 [Trichonephila inaurata madagascariensis]
MGSAEKWKARRKLLTPCFHADILRGYLPVFNECSQKLVEHLRQETKKDFTDIANPVTLTTMEVVVETMFGAKIESLHSNFKKYITALKRFHVEFLSSKKTGAEASFVSSTNVLSRKRHTTSPKIQLLNPSTVEIACD